MQSANQVISDEVEGIAEMSSMAAGHVQGPAGKITDEEETLIR